MASDEHWETCLFALAHLFFAHHPANSLQEYWWDFSVFCSSVAKETVSLFLDKKSKLVHNRQSAPKLQVISIGQFELILLSACLPYFAKTHSMFFIQQIKQKAFWDIIRET